MGCSNPKKATGQKTEGLTYGAAYANNSATITK